MLAVTGIAAFMGKCDMGQVIRLGATTNRKSTEAPSLQAEPQELARRLVTLYGAKRALRYSEELEAMARDALAHALKLGKEIRKLVRP